jgi:hypothetical protein
VERDVLDHRAAVLLGGVVAEMQDGREAVPIASPR